MDLFVPGFCIGYVGRAKRNGWAIRHKNTQERHNNPRWRRGVYDGGETGACTVTKAAVPCPAPLLLPDHGQTLLCHGVCQRWWPHVPNPAVWKVQGTRRGVSASLRLRMLLLCNGRGKMWKACFSFY